MKREKFVPNDNSRLCNAHFLPTDYNYGDANKPRLLPCAIPSVFSFPERLQKKPATRRPPKKRNINEIDEVPEQPDTKKQRVIAPRYEDKSTQTIYQPSSPMLRRKIKTLHQKLRRKNTKIESLAQLIDKLKEENYINTDAASILDKNFSGITNQLFKSELKNKGRPAKGHRYTEEIKKFALTLNFYSPRAYNFVRTVLSLPCPSALSNWTSSVKCDPGFLRDVFEYLKEKAHNDSSYRDCALIVDGMYVKSGVVYNKSKGCYEGFANFGEDIIAFDPDVIATEALVFMLVGLKGHWKSPVGYVLCNSTNATNLSCLISKALELASSHGLHVHSVTSDGLPANFDAMRSFGCQFGSVLKDIKGSFSHASFNHTLFFIPDACHMLKLARNALAEMKTFVDDSGNLIEWKYIKQLHDIQEEEGLKFANKLGKSHINFHKHKMNVKVAAQTLSSSVADAVEYLMKSGDSKFINATGTITFIRVIDQLFDLLNSRSAFSKGFKKPLFLHDSPRWISTIQKSVEYLIKLKDENGCLLVNHRRKTFVVGFIMALKSIKDLAMSLLSRNIDPFKFILTYKMSQDHLELLFACIRGKNGFNNNPDVVQLKSALRKILLRNSIVGSKYSNCLTFEQESAGSIFSLKWTRRRTPMTNYNALSDADTKYIADLTRSLQMVSLSAYKEVILGYIAGYIVRRLSEKINCNVCNLAMFSIAAMKDHFYSLFASPRHMWLINSKNRGGLVLPSNGVVKAVFVCERVFRAFVFGTDASKQQISSRQNIKVLMIHAINQQLSHECLFPELNEHDLEHEILTEDLHSSQLLKKIIEHFITLRLATYAKHYTRDVYHKHEVGLRQQSTKSVIFKGI